MNVCRTHLPALSETMAVTVRMAEKLLSITWLELGIWSQIVANPTIVPLQALVPPTNFLCTPRIDCAADN